MVQMSEADVPSDIEELDYAYIYDEEFEDLFQVHS